MKARSHPLPQSEFSEIGLQPQNPMLISYTEMHVQLKTLGANVPALIDHIS